MNRKETTELIYTISALFPKQNGFDGKSEEELTRIVDAWYEMLSDIDFGLAMASLKAHSAKSQYSPSIAEIRKAALGLVSGREVTAEEAWELCLSAVRKYGYARKAEAVKTLPESVRSIGERWFDEIGMTESENLGVTRGQFIKAFQIQSDRERDILLIPIDMLGNIKEIERRKRLMLEGV